MTCKNCGKKIPGGTDVCPECGGGLRPNLPNASSKSIFMREKTDHVVILYLKKSVVYITALVLVGLIVGINLISAVFSFFNRIDFTQYVLIDVSGFDGKGVLSVQVDAEALSDKLFDKKMAELDTAEQKRLSQVASLLQENLTLEEASSGFSNGDALTLKIENLDKISEVADKKCKKSDTIVYEVQGLKEATAVTFGDMFDVTFAGYDGAGCVFLTPKSDAVDWSVDGSYNQVYLDGSVTYTLNSATENAGTLSNGDSFSVGLSSLWDGDEEYFLEKYGAYISDEQTKYTVSGLVDSQSVDVLSMVEMTFTGVDGAARISYHWPQEEYQQDGIRIIPDNPQDGTFALYTGSVQDSDLGITILAEGEEVPFVEQNLGRFYLTPDKSGDISVGDTVTVTVRSDRFDLTDERALAPYGVKFTSLEKSITVDAAMIPRYITSYNQVNAENLSALAGSLKEQVMEWIYDDWSYLVHGNGNYTCYDQTFVDEPDALDIHLVCENPSSNTYAIWINYMMRVLDSELEEPIYVYYRLRLGDPVVYQDEEQTIGYNGLRREGTRDWPTVIDSWRNFPEEYDTAFYYYDY